MASKFGIVFATTETDPDLPTGWGRPARIRALSAKRQKQLAGLR